MVRDLRKLGPRNGVTAAFVHDVDDWTRTRTFEVQLSRTTNTSACQGWQLYVNFKLLAAKIREQAQMKNET